MYFRLKKLSRQTDGYKMVITYISFTSLLTFKWAICNQSFDWKGFLFWYASILRQLSKIENKNFWWVRLCNAVLYNIQIYSAFTLTWLMSFLQTLNFYCFRWLKEKNSTWKSLTINQVRVNGLYFKLPNKHNFQKRENLLIAFWIFNLFSESKKE